MIRIYKTEIDLQTQKRNLWSPKGIDGEWNEREMCAESGEGREELQASWGVV